MKTLHKSGVQTFITRVRREARQKQSAVMFKTVDRERVFIAYDWGCDTFVFEKDVWKNLENHSPVLIMRKSDLVKGANGYILTLTAGNHSVAAIPLLSGQFWNLGGAASTQRSETLRTVVVCANVVNGKIEISQRDVKTPVIVEADEWLQSVGFTLDDVVMAERNDTTLKYYREQGQEWRVKPLAWTRREMDAALAASRARINSSLRYYHSAKGVHFLAYPDFHAMTKLATTDYAGLVSCLRELVSIFDGEVRSFMRTPKFHGHNEIELFGLRRGAACERIVPELERLMEGITLKRVAPAEVAGRLRTLDALFKSMLERPALADTSSADFVETMYMHLTGEVYNREGEAVLGAFDDRRTALPGATFRGGRPDFHPGVDARTRVLLVNIEQVLSQNETIEYANIYEVRSKRDTAGSLAVGAGVTREILYKTDRRPLCTSKIEKRLALKTPGYGSYMLARVEAFKALGVGFGDYRLLMRIDSTAGRELNYFIRNRCPGEPLDDIPPLAFQRTGEDEEGEDPDVVLKLGALLGDAAAQNLVLKKYLTGQAGCRFGVGKEIFEFGYDITAKREMPMSVMLCSIRGCLGWPDLAQTSENFNTLIDFYFESYAQVLHRYWLKHKDAVSLGTLTERFFDGFEFKTREMEWNYSMRCEQFKAFDPYLPKHYAFTKKWLFALWALDEQLSRINKLRKKFTAKVREVSKAHGAEQGAKP